jgi:hypothetical protein
MRTAPCFRTAIFLSAICCAALPSLCAQTSHATSAASAAAQTAAPENEVAQDAATQDAATQNAATQNSGALLASDTGTVVVPPIAPIARPSANIVANLDAGTTAAPIVIIPPPDQPDPVRSHRDGYRIVEVHPRLGRTFWALWIANAGLTVASIELTENCVHQPRYCQEQNPIFGNRPGRAELYGFKGSIVGAQFLLARHWKLRGDRAWKFTTGASLAMNTLDASWDAYATASHSSPLRPASH